MAIAALVISIAAILISAASVFYTRRQAVAAAVQAVAATKQTGIEEERRHHEQEPDLQMDLEDRGGWHRLRVEIIKSTPLVRIDAKIIDSAGVQFRQGTDGVLPQSRVPVLDAFYLPEFKEKGAVDLVPGESAYWVLELDRQYDKRIRVQLRCEDAAGKSWTVIRYTDLPPSEYDVLNSVH